jgi:putrescine transport system ATP-binding protein
MKKRLSAVQLNDPWNDINANPYMVIEDVFFDARSVSVLDSVSISVYRGEFFSILGESGCGKSTLLRLISGLEKPTSGKIIIDDIDLTNMAPYNRPVNMMFQSYGLFPHMTVYENIAFGLKQDQCSDSVLKERVASVLSLTKLEKHASKYTNQLSGGERQRVALARCLAKRPKVLLLDEPLAALDKNLREETQFEIVNIQEEVGITFIMVTHDQEEAMTMSTRMAIMHEGRMRQIGTPSEIYEYPNSLYVANFVGSINIFDGIVMEEDDDHVIVKSSEIQSDLRVHGSTAVGSHISVGVRPEKVMIIKATEEEKHNSYNGLYNIARGTVHDIGYLGDVSIYHVELESGKIVLATQSNSFRLAERPVTWNDNVILQWDGRNSLLLSQ